MRRVMEKTGQTETERLSFSVKKRNIFLPIKHFTSLKVLLKINQQLSKTG